jgi:antitoxin FitA
MAQVLIRGLEQSVVQRLKQRAAAKGRSLEAELRAVIEQAASFDAKFAETRELAARLRRRLAGRTFSDSAELIADDRRR